jgi:hypothetical protein
VSDLTTLANVRAYLNSTGGTANTVDDPLLERMVSAASAFVERWCDRAFLSATYTEMRSGTGTRVLAPFQWPIQSIASLSVDGVAIPARPAVGASGYYADTDFVYLDGYSFTRGRANVVLAYTAGYNDVPLDVEQAVIEMVATAYRSRDRIGLVSKGFAGETTVFSQKDIPPTAKTALEGVRRR